MPDTKNEFTSLIGKESKAPTFYRVTENSEGYVIEPRRLPNTAWLLPVFIMIAALMLRDRVIYWWTALIGAAVTALATFAFQTWFAREFRRGPWAIVNKRSRSVEFLRLRKSFSVTNEARFQAISGVVYGEAHGELNIVVRDVGGRLARYPLIVGNLHYGKLFSEATGIPLDIVSHVAT